MKNSSSKNYAKHCFNYERTLVEKIGIDTEPVVSNGRKEEKIVEISHRMIDMGFKHKGITDHCLFNLICHFQSS